MRKSTLSRRDFLRGVGATAAGVAAMGVLAGCSSTSSSTTSSSTTSTTTTTAAAADTAEEDSEEEASETVERKVGATVFKLSFNQTEDNPEAVAVEEMSDKLWAATDGRYSIEVYPNETLGSQQESLELVQTGVIEMALIGNSLFENINKDFAVIGTPYVYDSIDHQQKLFETDALDELFESTYNDGFVAIAVYSLGARNVYAKVPVSSPEDLSGLKIRVMQSDTVLQMIDLMGAEGVTMSQGDVYTAIQTGVLDGAENNIITYTTLLQYEVADQYSLTNHLLIPDEMIISTYALEQMSEEDQAALRQLAKESIPDCFERCAEFRDYYFDLCQSEYGVTVTEIDDISPFQECCQPLIDEVVASSDVTQAIYDKILELR